ncbi:hypothetical protein BDZ45DRAFT_798610 [Acephala macrosclerotiorum]|nr:hypothetical protein BDZ45DRAFT_798610 [Acephala macrosclerotiorum]
MLLLICQSFLGHVGQWSTHGQGAAQILKARAYYDPNDKFESKLVLSLRGPVLFEALVNPKLSFSPEEWSTLVENHLDGGSYEEQTDTDVEALESETACHYDTLKATLGYMHTRLRSIPDNPSADNKQSGLSLTTLHAFYQRSYGLCLAICIIVNCIFKALDPNNAGLEADSTAFCQKVLDVAEKAAKYRPVGASFVFLCLIVARCDNADTIQLPAKVQAALLDYRMDFASPEVRHLEAELAYAHRRLSLREA